MKLKKEFLIHETRNETYLVPTGDAGFSGIVRGNQTLETILELLKTDTDEAAIVAAIQSRFDAPKEVIAADVKKALSELRKIGALDE